MGLLDFPCGWRTDRPEASPLPPSTRTEPAAPSTSVAPVESTGGSPENRRRRSSHGSASPWRPSLVAINEDGALPVVSAASSAPATPARKKNKAGGGGPPAAKAAKVKPAGRVAPRPVTNDYRHYNGIPTVMPAFGPAPFWF